MSFKMDPTTSTKYDNAGYSTNKKKENCKKPSCMNIKTVIDNRYINNIQILCLILKWDFPKYDYFINMDMVPGRYGHTVLNTAIYSTMIYKSIGRKKNVVKNKAAKKMYEQIINLSKDEIDNILQHCKHKIPWINFDNKKTLEISTSPGILKIVRELFGRLHNNPCLKNLKELDSFENISAVNMLNTIAVGEDLSLPYFVREQISDVGNVAEINIIYGMVFVGFGLTISQAKESAAFAALMYVNDVNIINQKQ